MPSQSRSYALDQLARTLARACAKAEVVEWCRKKSEMIINLMYIYHKHCEIMEKFSTPKPKPLFGKTQKLVAAGFPKVKDYLDILTKSSSF